MKIANQMKSFSQKYTLAYLCPTVFIWHSKQSNILRCRKKTAIFATGLSLLLTQGVTLERTEWIKDSVVILMTPWRRNSVRGFLLGMKQSHAHTLKVSKPVLGNLEIQRPKTPPGMGVMAEDKNSGDKTELPTQKKLRDARKKGDVAKSKDVGAAFVTIFWLVLIGLASGFIVREVVAVAQLALDKSTTLPFSTAMEDILKASFMALMKLSLLTLLPIAVLATLVEFAQVGPIATAEKMKPSFDKLNPAEGLKRMFGKDGLVELVKTLAKALLVVMVVAIVLKSAIGQSSAVLGLVQWSPLAGNGAAVAEAAGAQVYGLTLQLFSLVILVFIFVAILDRIYTRHSFIKKMMMSRRDIKQEHKEDEGDPYIKGTRRQMHEEWANQNAIGATGGAAALLVNPTHLAIALDYDGKDTPVPVIAAKGEGPLAAAMRAEAERMNVPIVRNVATARRLWSRGEVGEIVPEDMFDAIAEVILWAKKAREGKAGMWTDLDAGKLDVMVREEMGA